MWVKCGSKFVNLDQVIYVRETQSGHNVALTNGLYLELKNSETADLIAALEAQAQHSKNMNRVLGQPFPERQEQYNGSTDLLLRERKVWG